MYFSPFSLINTNHILSYRHIIKFISYIFMTLMKILLNDFWKLDHALISFIELIHYSAKSKFKKICNRFAQHKSEEMRGERIKEQEKKNERNNEINK